MATTNGRGVDAVFFDIFDTLGEMSQPGQLQPYRPSTQKLLEAMRNLGLKIGVIVDLPANMTADDGRRMLETAVLSEDAETGEKTTIADLVDSDAIVINHDAGSAKPDPRIFLAAAEKVGLPPERCAFVGENLIDVLSARAAGMQGQLKPTPPGREFQPAVITKLGESERDSGRAFEAFLEHEHLLGEVLFDAAERIARDLKDLNEGDPIPDNVKTAMGLLMYVLNNFAAQAHFAAEEAVIPLAVARGLDERSVQWVFDHHEQAKAYWRVMTLAWDRIQRGDPRDTWYAIGDFWRSSEAFVILLRHHAEREEDELYPSIGRHFSDADDTLALNLIATIGPRDFTPFVGLVMDIQQALSEVPATA
jgi:hemerythrin-like domain-containing protein